MRDLINGFLDRLAARRSLATVEAYRRDLLRFAAYIEERGLAEAANDVTPIHVLGFLAYMEEGGASSSTARALSALKTFYGDLLRRNITNHDPTEDVTPPPIGRQTKHRTHEGLTISIEGSGGADLRDRAIITLLAEGFKPGQIIALNVSDVYDGGMIRVNAGRQTDIKRLKNAAPVLEYIERGRKEFLKDNNGKALFLNRFGKPMTRQYIWKLVNKFESD